MKIIIHTPSGNFEPGFYSPEYSLDMKTKNLYFLGSVLYNFPCDELKVHLEQKPLNSEIIKTNNVILDSKTKNGN